MGTQTCSVHPGNTVDSKMTKLFLDKSSPIISEADKIGLKFGVLFFYLLE